MDIKYFVKRTKQKIEFETANVTILRVIFSCNNNTDNDSNYDKDK